MHKYLRHLQLAQHQNRHPEVVPRRNPQDLGVVPVFFQDHVLEAGPAVKAVHQPDLIRRPVRRPKRPVNRLDRVLAQHPVQIKRDDWGGHGENPPFNKLTRIYAFCSFGNSIWYSKCRRASSSASLEIEAFPVSFPIFFNAFSIFTALLVLIPTTLLYLIIKVSSVK